MLIFMMLSIPFSSSVISYSEAQSAVVCCDDAHDVELYLVGGSTGELTPFSQLLTDEANNAVIANSITSQETVGLWSFGRVWPGSIPDSTWNLVINYRVSDAGGAQINATATVKIGSQVFSDSTDLDSSVLAQGEGQIQFAIPVEAMSVSASSEIELELSARSVVFSVPGGDAKLEFLWGSEEFSSSISAEIPLMELSIDEPQVEGGDVYLSAVIDSPFGLDALAYSDSIEMFVDGLKVDGDPIETKRGDSIVVTWTWIDADSGTNNVQVSVRLNLQPDGPLIQGSTQFTIQVTDTGGGTGTFYPEEEPLRTSGSGSPLAIEQLIDLSSDDGQLKMAKTTILEIDGEMAFWMRWGMDHIGDTDLSQNSVLFSWDKGGVTDENRESKNIENVEKEQFERQMKTRYRNYMSAINGMQLQSNELIGDSGDFDTISVSVDLMGETRVVNHPLSITFSTLQTLQSGQQIELLRSFTTTQTTPIWQDYSITVEAKSSVLTSFGNSEMLESDYLSFSHSRFPWGEVITIEASSTSLDEDFTIIVQPNDNLLFAPMPLTIITLVIVLFGMFSSLSMTKNKHRRFLNLEFILMPIIGLIYIFSYPPLFVFAASGGASMLWIVTGLISPRKQKSSKQTQPEIQVDVPTVACPSCDTNIPVLSDERPLRIACGGCGKTIKIVG
ncbi:MAG: hypothetical protein VXV81_00745 [Candidatus Thermoplasmatota archaeon]|nr:hypothetical protein [Candidatus Thermoplasmatota archaeon]|tara:strand:+ start:954 stop:2969 length:2016 start_codon:yes stop_codon:yes gene_type:complete